MQLFQEFLQNPAFPLIFFGSTIFSAIAGSPVSVLKVAPADWDPMAHSKAFYRSPRAFLSPLLLWASFLLAAALFDLFPSAGGWRGSFILFPVIAVYLCWKIDERLLKGFLATLPPAPAHRCDP